MPPRIPATPRIPGEAAPTEDQEKALDANQPEDDALIDSGAAGGDSAASAPAAEETVTVSKASLDALMARVAALESHPAQVKRNTPRPTELPDESQFDVAKLKNPVLTKQGWLVPESYGANPSAPKAF